MNAEMRWDGKLVNNNGKVICAVYSLSCPIQLPRYLQIELFEKASAFGEMKELHNFEVLPKGELDVQEWKKFQSFLFERKKVAVLKIKDICVQLIMRPSPGEEPNYFTPALVSYRKLVQRKREGVMHPEYLTTLSQTHASWLFGGLAELIDNARDAQATRLDISINRGTLPGATDDIPLLRVVDNGTGMDHDEMLKMVSFGHERPSDNDPNQIGLFGVGFKTGAMRLGRDAAVLTQSKETRSLALLSTSLNQGKEALEVPIVTYFNLTGRMPIDTRVQRKEEAAENEKSIMNFLPFDVFHTGQRFGELGHRTGTSIYIYNLEKWGTSYCLDWDNGEDIMIRSRRVRTRPGQTSQEVPLDYSLRSYLEVIFLEPRMIFSIHGKQVKTRCLGKTLNNTKVSTGILLGKTVELTLGRSEVEFKRGNCGAFLYWHGRLIEAYKRVGNMVHSADWGRGVIGVVDTTELMDFGNGRVGVLNSKQGFEDSEAYATLEQWLGQEVDDYWEEHVEKLQIGRSNFSPDLDWVQCNKCLKWRILKKEWNVNKDELPDEWFCYMPPYNGACKDPEDKMKNIVTVSTKRNRLEQGESCELSDPIKEPVTRAKKKRPFRMKKET